MIRLFLFLLLLAIFNYSGIANEGWNLTDKFGVGDHSGMTAKFDSFTPLLIGEGVVVATESVSQFLPDIKKSLYNDSKQIDAIKIKMFSHLDAELLFLIRKDNLFLSILRI